MTGFWEGSADAKDALFSKVNVSLLWNYQKSSYAVITPGPGITCEWVNLIAAARRPSKEWTMGTSLDFRAVFAAPTETK